MNFDKYKDILAKHESSPYADECFCAKEWRFVVGQPKNQTTLGYCSFSKKQIVISQWLVESGQEHELHDTILHEMAHALAGVEISRTGRAMVHGRRWKYWARILGAQPKAKTANVILSEQRKTKYLVLYYDQEANSIEVLVGAGRKLQNLAARAAIGRESETFGNLWMIESKHYSEDVESCKRYMFR